MFSSFYIFILSSLHPFIPDNLPTAMNRRERSMHTEGAPGRENAQLLQRLRTRIAQAAAKLISEGLSDYHAAKLKAARQLGCVDNNALPDNHEIEAALREHQSIFAADTQPEALAALRHTALRAMRWLQIEAKALTALGRGDEAAFAPWLTGAVLNGTANEFGEIELELVGVEAKTIEFMLLNRGVEFELQEAKVKSKSFKPVALARAIRYHLEFEAAPLVITLYESHAQRQALYPRGSIKHDRLQLDDATRFFAVGNDVGAT